jgi:hypothetical protein
MCTIIDGHNRPVFSRISAVATANPKTATELAIGWIAMNKSAQTTLVATPHDRRRLR